MTRPARSPAFQGGLWNVHYDGARRRAVVEVAIPADSFIRFLQDVGQPPLFEDRELQWSDGDLRPVMLLACRRPRHPESENDVMAEAAIALLEEGLADGTLPLTPALTLRFDALRARLDGTPIHIMPAANADQPEET